MTELLVSQFEQQTKEHALLGAALLASQKFEFTLHRTVCKLAAELDESERQVLNLNPDTFLKGNTADLELTFNLYHQLFGDKLALSTRELMEFSTQRNLVVRNYWRVTGADIKGGEKLGDSEAYLQQFYAKCELWLARIEK